MMRKTLFAAALAVSMGGAALAQDTPQQTRTTTNEMTMTQGGTMVSGVERSFLRNFEEFIVVQKLFAELGYKQARTPETRNLARRIWLQSEDISSRWGSYFASANRWSTDRWGTNRTMPMDRGGNMDRDETRQEGETQSGQQGDTSQTNENRATSGTSRQNDQDNMNQHRNSDDYNGMSMNYTNATDAENMLRNIDPMYATKYRYLFNKVGTNFDNAYLEFVIRSHNNVIQRFMSYDRQGKDSPLREMATGDLTGLYDNIWDAWKIKTESRQSSSLWGVVN